MPLTGGGEIDLEKVRAAATEMAEKVRQHREEVRRDGSRYDERRSLLQRIQTETALDGYAKIRVTSSSSDTEPVSLHVESITGDQAIAIIGLVKSVLAGGREGE